ncbi:MAG: dTMP kinase [Bacteroidales bacterium]|nr:dTMP kinase [Bacteroidales bacterium]MDD2425067.1 dTMP kinase [Bacteroidales bacterium]MDD3988624.1 dTMP kinase [Bacteroidales bacterium]MDD4639686.1 dTMP kinase [Bacteroidales bacterium]
MLIVLEGLDGAGKSTQIKMLQNLFKNKNRGVQYLHFPRFGAPVFGDLIARYLRGEFGDAGCTDPYLIALLFAEDRREASTQIRVWLEKGDCVILDRYVLSNIAFQCAKYSDKEKAKSLRDWILETEYKHFGLPEADISLFLDVPLSFVESKLNNERTGDDREYLRGKSDIHEESMDYQRRVREIYLNECAAGNHLRRIDCSGKDGGMLSADNIHSMIAGIVEEGL